MSIDGIDLPGWPESEPDRRKPPFHKAVPEDEAAQMRKFKELVEREPLEARPDTMKAAAEFYEELLEVVFGPEIE